MSERGAKAIFEIVSAGFTTAKWEFGAGGVNVSEEMKDRYRRAYRAAIAAYRADLKERGLCIVKRATLHTRFREEYEHDGYSTSGADQCAGSDVQSMIAAGDVDD